MWKPPFPHTWSRWPSQCVVCRAWGTQAVCEDCVRRFAPPQSRCPHCAALLAADQPVCGECLQSPAQRLDACVCALPYAFPWDHLVAHFKFQGHTGLARPLAALLRSAPWAERLLEQCDALVPIPLSATRLRERGYNQALELARALHRSKTQPRWLRRVRHTPNQHDLPRAQRLRAVHGSLAVEPTLAAGLQGRHAVLVDDVMTTGATLREAARVLRLAGATQVSALVLARTDSGH